jgi:hypothetical protein
VVGLLPSASGPACLGMAFPPILMKQSYRCDSVVISSFVKIQYTTRKWGWLLGRIGYSITHHYPLYPFSEKFFRNIDWLYKEGQCVGPTGRQSLFVFRGHKLNGAKFTWHSIFNSNKLTNQMQQFYKFITWRYVSLNMFRAPPRPSSGAYNCINSLWCYLGAWW